MIDANYFSSEEWSLLSSIGHPNTVNSDTKKNTQERLEFFHKFKVGKCHMQTQIDGSRLLLRVSHVARLTVIEAPFLNDTTYSLFKYTPHLKKLTMGGKGLYEDRDLSALVSAFTWNRIELTKLVLLSPRIPQRPLDALKQLTTIQELALVRLVFKYTYDSKKPDGLTSDCLSFLEFLPQLRALNLSLNPYVDKSLFDTLKKCTSLKTLDITMTDISRSDGLTEILNIPSIQNVSFDSIKKGETQEW